MTSAPHNKFESYSITGKVSSLTAPYNLAGHEPKKFAVIGFVSKRTDGIWDWYNGVFYLDFEHRAAAEMFAMMSRSLVESREISIEFEIPHWDKISDPGGYIITVCL